MASSRSPSLSSDRSGSSHSGRGSAGGDRSVSEELDEMLNVETGYVTAAADQEELNERSRDMEGNGNDEVQETHSNGSSSGSSSDYRDASEHLPEEEVEKVQGSIAGRPETAPELSGSSATRPEERRLQGETTPYPPPSSASEKRESVQVHDLLEASESSASIADLQEEEEQVGEREDIKHPMKDMSSQSAGGNIRMRDNSIQSVPETRRAAPSGLSGGRRERSQSPVTNRSGMRAGSSRRLLQQQYQRRAQPNDISKQMSMSDIETGVMQLPIRRTKSRETDSTTGTDKRAGEGRPLSLNALPAPMHTSMSHINYHDRKKQLDDSNSSNFDLDWTAPTAHQSLSQHLMATGSGVAGGYDKLPAKKSTVKSDRESVTSMDVTVNLQDSDPDIKSKIGDLSKKPVTAASLAARASSDKSASSTLFAPRKTDTVDQSVNLMDPTAGTYESGSTSSGSGSGTRRGISMSAPSRPKKYGARPIKANSNDQDSFFASSLLSFLETPQASTEKNNTPAARKRRDLQSSGAKWCNYSTGLLLVLFVVVGCTLIVTQTGWWDTVVGVGEASKSGTNNDVVIRTNLRDGEGYGNTVHLTRGGDGDRNGTLSIQFSTMESLRTLLVEHGISESQELRWDGFQEDYGQFVKFSSRTKALIWLAHAEDVNGPPEEPTETIHRKLFQRYTLAVFYYEMHEGATHSNCNDLDTLLLQMHYSMWVNYDSWMMGGTSICDWYGVFCDEDRAEEEVVLALNLTGNGLKGSLPLREMNYAFRWNLKRLVLSENAISGNLDDLEEDGKGSSWPQLEYLYLQDNELNGHVPYKWLQSCKKLKGIDLSRNGFSGSVPRLAFGSHENLLALDLGHNKLKGKVEVLGYLPKLEFLSLEGNQFNNAFPKEVFQLTSLVELRACCNGFSGGIPTELAYMSNLEILSLEYNDLEMHLPDVFQSTTSLVQLALHSNDFDGALPTSLGSLKQLEILALENNRFSGTLPTELSELTRLKSLLIYHNDITGTVPVCSLKEGISLFSKELKYIAADCKDDLTCSCCDECY